MCFVHSLFVPMFISGKAILSKRLVIPIRDMISDKFTVTLDSSPLIKGSTRVDLTSLFSFKSSSLFHFNLNTAYSIQNIPIYCHEIAQLKTG